MPADKNMRILVVDDFSTMRKIIKNILRQLGYNNVVESDDGTTAWETLNRDNIDFIISDWNMQTKQEEFLVKLRANAQLEQDLVDNFGQRQEELTRLDSEIGERVIALNKLLKQADEYARSPQFLRQIVITGHRQGKSIKELAKATGIAADEVELIIDQSGL